MRLAREALTLFTPKAPRRSLVCQDWGGLIGLRLVGEHPDRFARVVAANTFLPTGDVSPGEAFFNWQRFSQEVEVFPTGFIVNSGCVSDLAPEVQAAYDAPFPDESFKAGARAFPMLVPSSPHDHCGCGHFLQEDRGAELARVVVDFIASPT